MKNSDIAVKVHDLYKSFDLPENRTTSIKQMFVSVGSKKRKLRQDVIRGIDFEVKKGDFFGIVGKNGSGKSTLLKILAGIYSPDKGAVLIDGNLTPFIELGVGFNPELTGRDNVFLSASLLGFTRAQTEEMYDEIVDFAELGEHMDKKLKNYSSGMQVRLSFSIAVKARNDILIFDEVLAVGDEAFQRKCSDTFERYKAEKQTIILVTHDMSSVKKYCNRALLLDEGIIKTIGEPAIVSNSYVSINNDAVDSSGELTKPNTDSIQIKVSLSDEDNITRKRFNYKQTARVHIDLGDMDTRNIESVGVTLVKNTGEHVTGLNCRTNEQLNWQKTHKLSLDIKLKVFPGRYYLVVEAFSEPGKVYAGEYKGPSFIVSEDTSVDWSGIVELEHGWKNEIKETA